MDKQLIRQRLASYAPPIAAFEGWNEMMARQACDAAGVSAAEYTRSCPNGFLDILDSWMLMADDAMAEGALLGDIHLLKIRERIQRLVWLRLMFFAEHKEALRRSCSLLALPWHMASGVAWLARSVDRMWMLAGDQSNDYNWYTKRILLSGVYSSTLIYWLNDESADSAETKAFLERRIANVLSIGAWIGKRQKAGVA